MAIGSIFGRDLAFEWICLVLGRFFGRVMAIGSIFGRDLGFELRFRFWVDF